MIPCRDEIEKRLLDVYLSKKRELAEHLSQIIYVLQDIFEGRNVVVVPHGVDTVIHGDIAHAVPWEEVLDKLPGLQVVPA